MSYTEPPEGFVWEQPDAMRLRHEACGETVRAEVVDLHLQTCDEAEAESNAGVFSGP